MESVSSSWCRRWRLPAEVCLNVCVKLCFALSLLAGCTHGKPAVIHDEADNKDLPWVVDGRYSPQALELVDVARNAYRYGLNPGAYNLETLHSTVTLNSQIDEAQPGKAFTRLYNKLARDLLFGLLEPPESKDWMASAPEGVTVPALLECSFRDNTVAKTLESLQPHHQEYARLRGALEAYRQISKGGGWTTVPWGAELKKGDSGDRVAFLRQRLAVSGDLPRAAAGSDGREFDEAVELAVRVFQRRHGLEPSGIVDVVTLRELNLPVEARIRQLELNMERWRWLPRQVADRYVVVDIPAFRLRLVEKGNTILSSPVVVGQPSWKTPVFSSSITSIVLNPPWVIPDSITLGEMVPQIRSDPSFLAANHIEVEKGPEHVPNSSIDPASVQWQQVGQGKPDFILVQKKGGANPMGSVKFVVRGERSIYIHDTPQKELFDQEMRLFSHGCVRTKEPVKLAAHLVGSSDPVGAEKELAEKIATDQEVKYQLTSPVPVYFVYFTAAVEEDGTVNFRPDIYGHDIPLYRTMLANNLFTD